MIWRHSGGVERVWEMFEISLVDAIFLFLYS